MPNDDNSGRPSFTIGKSSSDYVCVIIDRRTIATARDYWDGNWLNGRVEIAAGGFRGKFNAQFRTTDFQGFRAKLEKLYEVLEGEARFETMEEQLQVSITGDGQGHFLTSCLAMDEAGVGHRLEFDLSFDQTDIPEIIRGLERIVSAFPTIAEGTREGKS